MAKTKTARKPVAVQATVTPLDKHDPRVRAAAAELIAEIVKKQEAKRAAQVEKAAKDRAALEQAEKPKAKKRASVKEIVSRLNLITEPLYAVHESAERAIGTGGGYETALIVASNLAMICLKRLDDCLEDLDRGHMTYSAEEWLAGTERF